MTMLNEAANKQTRLFVGKEVEHTKHFGCETLFIVSDVPIDKIVEAGLSTQGVDHFYFGAGGLSVINTDTVAKVVELEIVNKVTLEGNIGPTDVQNIKGLRELEVAVVLPVTNTGVFIGATAVSLAVEWLDWLTSRFESNVTVYLKVDTADPFVFIAPLLDLAGKLTRPSAYANDVEVHLEGDLSDVI